MGSESLPMRFCPLHHSTVQSNRENPRSTTTPEAVVRVDLNDADGLECRTWAIYDGVYLPRDPPMLPGYHDWQWIIARTMFCLIYQSATADEHCPPCTVTSLNAGQVVKEAA